MNLLAASRTGTPRRVSRWTVGAIALVLVGACSSAESCDTAEADPACPDLRYSDEYYDEWRAVDAPAVLQEVGDGVYPACNDAEICGTDFGGYASTDVWLLEGVDLEAAIIGYRQGTETHVIFVRRGVDPDTLPPLPEAAN